MLQEDSLLFVCNNDSGVLPRIKDYSAHSSTSPAEGCNLSALIQSPLGIKKEWKRFIREQKLPSRILDRNDFCNEFGSGISTFPVVLVTTGRGTVVLISTDELNRCRELEDLMSLVEQRLSRIALAV
nr:hypothetical protein [uncultured Methanoregula sp.]